MKSVYRAQTELEGLFKFTLIKPDGSKRVVAEFKNLILNQGLNSLGTGAPFSYVSVGSGSAAPANTDTGMLSPVARASSVVATLSGYSSAAPWYAWHRRTYRFAAGVAAGNLSEVGVGSSDNNTSLFSRALIRDAEGNPTTITVLSDEVLDVMYELRFYSPVDDVLQTINLSGTPYDVLIRTASANTNWSVQQIFQYGFGNSGFSYCSAYTGAPGTVVQTPGGTGLGAGSVIVQPYANNSLKRAMTLNFALGEGNDVAGIGTIMVGPFSTALFQIGFMPQIPKDNTKVLSIPVEFSWARKA